MTLGERIDAGSLPAQLEAAAALRIPRATENDGVRERLDALDTYMLDSAFHQGELEESRLRVYDALRTIEHEWDAVVGWETLRRGRTDSSIDEAKKQVRGDLWKAMQDARWLISRITEQINRLERDAQKCSRSHTFKTGA